MSAAPTLKRCAIYTRKSTEDGLEQEFNSLDAQREACAAYILSQRHEGWRELPAYYDDGGISGGTMERPALQRLLEDVKAGRIDVVVVYKVDRLTRSLPDFAKIVEIFDTADVSFVSVTQSFNTTSSMGRLTLNVLLSFAQFEREVTAERIRDKVAASKRKGMWMGGVVPLGYDAIDKALVVNDEQAAMVRMIFERYRALGSVRALQNNLADQKIVSPVRPNRKPDGRPRGGKPYSCGALNLILRNVIYRGEVRHRGERHPGRHEAIIDEALWTDVQSQLDGQGGGKRIGKRRAAARILDGMLFDAEGQALRTTYAVKKSQTKEGWVRKRYWYYATRDGNTDSAPTRLPAEPIETLVIETLAGHLKDRVWIGSAVAGLNLSAGTIASILDRAQMYSKELTSSADAVIGDVLATATIGPAELTITLKNDWLAGDALLPDLIIDYPEISVPITFHQSGRARPIVIRNAEDQPFRDPDLIALVADARRWMAMLVSGEAASVNEITQIEGRAKGTVSRILTLAYLAPDISKAIMDGSQPRDLTATRLRRVQDLPMDWQQQRLVLGFAQA